MARKIWICQKYPDLSRSSPEPWAKDHLGSYFRELSHNFNFLCYKYLNPLLRDPDPGTGAFLTLDPGSEMENSDPQH
jgi:hypothetical protein